MKQKVTFLTLSVCQILVNEGHGPGELQHTVYNIVRDPGLDGGGTPIFHLIRLLAWLLMSLRGPLTPIPPVTVQMNFPNC